MLSRLRPLASAVAVGLVLGLVIGLAPDAASAQGTGPIVKNRNMQTAAVATANGLTLDTGQAAIAVLQVLGTFSGTVTFEASTNGSTWVNLFCSLIAATNPVTGVTNVATSTAPNMYRCNVSGIPVIRARVSAYTSGSITVIGMATSLPSGAGNALAN